MTCQWCGSEVYAGAFLCDRCVQTLDVALANIGAHHDDLDTLRTKRARYGSANASKGSVGKEVPMPLDGRFADPTGSGSRLWWETRNTITTWTRVALEEWEPITGPTCRECLHITCHEIRRRRQPRDSVASCCAYLAGHRSGIAGKQWAGQLIDEVLDLERRLSRMVDRPADGWYAGVCGSVTATEAGEVVCERDLYAEPRSPFVRCRDCGCTYDVDARRAALLDEAREREATVRTLARIVTTLGDVNVSEARIEGRINLWVHRGRLRAHGRRVIDGKVRATYRVGDVLDLLTDDVRQTTA